MAEEEGGVGQRGAAGDVSRAESGLGVDDCMFVRGEAVMMFMLIMIYECNAYRRYPLDASDLPFLRSISSTNYYVDPFLCSAILTACVSLVYNM